MSAGSGSWGAAALHPRTSTAEPRATRKMAVPKKRFGPDAVPRETTRFPSLREERNNYTPAGGGESSTPTRSSPARVSRYNAIPLRRIPVPTSTEPTEEEFMRMAIAMAVENARAARGGPFAALVVRDGRVIGKGANSVTATNDPTAHAEVVAIREACRTLGSFQLTGCDLYSTCEPCSMCTGAIYWARPARVFYAAAAADSTAAGFDDAFVAEQVCQPPEARRLPMTQLLREESLAAFAEWEQNPRRIRY
jgi:guanine deaminase